MEEVARGRDQRGSLTVAPSLIHAAETELTVRLERPHAELLGEGEGLPVALLGPVEVRRLALQLDRREQPENVRLVPALAQLLGEVKGLSGDGERALGPFSLHMR